MVIIEFIVKFLTKQAYRSTLKARYDRVLCINMCSEIVADIYMFILYSYILSRILVLTQSDETLLGQLVTFNSHGRKNMNNQNGFLALAYGGRFWEEIVFPSYI